MRIHKNLPSEFVSRKSMTISTLCSRCQCPISQWDSIFWTVFKWNKIYWLFYRVSAKSLTMLTLCPRSQRLKHAQKMYFLVTLSFKEPTWSMNKIQFNSFFQTRCRRSVKHEKCRIFRKTQSWDLVRLICCNILLKNK